MDAIIIVFFISIGILVLINLFYRFLINQKEATRIKDRVKELGDEMKKATGDKQRISSLYSDMMKEQGKLMKMSLKPMLISFVVVACFLPVINMFYGDMPSTTMNAGLNVANVTLGGPQNFGGAQYYLEKIGNNTIKINKVNSDSCNIYTLEKNNTDNTIVKVENDTCELLPCNRYICDNRYVITEKVTTSANQTDTKIVFSNVVAATPFTLPFVGSQWVWLYWYILVSLPMMIVIRKLYGIKV